MESVNPPPETADPSDNQDIILNAEPEQTNEGIDDIRQVRKLKKRSSKPRRPRPSREADQNKHEHHILPVNSNTDFANMRILEKKINYLPYHPPAAVSQTGLVQSIGKPFSRNHAKLLPDPGDDFQLTRRVSQVKLHQVALLGEVNPSIIFGLEKTLKFFALCIGICGLCFLVYILIVAGLNSPFEYSQYFLDSYQICKAVHIVGVIQPMAVASYCRFALIDLRFIRSYYLRVPFLQISPLGVALCGGAQLYTILRKDQEFTEFLFVRMDHYFKSTYISTLAKTTWDETQTKYDCCGYNKPMDWDKYNTSEFPKSCCSKEEKPCNGQSPSLKKKSCKSTMDTINIVIAVIYVAIAAAIFILEIISVLVMRRLHVCIRDEVYDERANLVIIFGDICSLCTIPDTDEDLEYDEPPETANENVPVSQNVKSNTAVTGGLNSENVAQEDASAPPRSSTDNKPDERKNEPKMRTAKVAPAV